MNRTPQIPDIPRADWDRPPWNRWTFQHVADILPTVTILRGTKHVQPLPRDEQPLDTLEVGGIGGAPVTLAAFLGETFTDGIVVLHRGSLVYERYLNGMDETTLHLSQSVAKSFTGALAGILFARGIVDVEADICDVLPDLAATAYRGARIRHVLDMASGVRFDETYTNPFSDMGRADVAAGWKPVPPVAPEGTRWPRSMHELVLTLTAQEAAHGSRFAYRSIETDVLAMVLERASGKPLARLMSEELWQPLGMEQHANMTIDAAGFALADGGLNACLRDYARFGQAILAGGAGVIPPQWIDETRSADHALFRPPYTGVLPGGGYRNQFWVEDRSSRNLMARGVFGQLIHIDFAWQVVVVKLSSWPEFVNPAWTIATLAAVRRIGEALSPRA